MSHTTLRECSTEQCEAPTLFFNQEIPFDSQQRYYIVVALSERKQIKMMEAARQVHSSNQPFPTWGLISQALSKALFTEPDRLRLKSTMELHRKDYLLFEQECESASTNMSGIATATESILEVDIGSQLDRITWLCSWKTARPVVAGLVRGSLETLAQLGEPKRPQPDIKCQDGVNEAEGTTAKKY